MSAPAPEVVLSAEGLVGGYVPEVDILRGCTLTAAEGEIVVVIGPNGAGKSTLAKAIFGLVRLREGRVLLRGQDITGAHTHEVTAQGMSYVPQVGNVFPSLTVLENLEVGGVLRRRQTRERMDRMMTLFPRLGERRRQRAGTLSGGERQMLAMARALMPDPAVLLLDEPSAGLAPRAVGEVFETVADINGSGVTIVMIEQNARRALGVADRGYVLENGQNRFEGAGDALLTDPQVAELYLGGAPRGDGRSRPRARRLLGDAGDDLVGLDELAVRVAPRAVARGRWVAGLVEVDRAGRPLVVDVLAVGRRGERLLKGLEGVLVAGRPGDGLQVLGDGGRVARAARGRRQRDQDHRVEVLGVVGLAVLADLGSSRGRRTGRLPARQTEVGAVARIPSVAGSPILSGRLLDFRPSPVNVLAGSQLPVRTRAGPIFAQSSA